MYSRVWLLYYNKGIIYKINNIIIYYKISIMKCEKYYNLYYDIYLDNNVVLYEIFIWGKKSIESIECKYIKFWF